MKCKEQWVIGKWDSEKEKEGRKIKLKRGEENKKREVKKNLTKKSEKNEEKKWWGRGIDRMRVIMWNWLTKCKMERKEKRK